MSGKPEALVNRVQRHASSAVIAEAIGANWIATPIAASTPMIARRERRALGRCDLALRWRWLMVDGRCEGSAGRD
ncbi:MAG: hypothetical protein U1E76_00520 [Planctomycetota bacterium]